ncbi:hypothetical protein HMPREF1055_00914 [Bacteroides fragilis CL07T00C01]|uniref:Uncharacterized protein n=1 Tax=Bacteroides fragilis CL07T12C05 TaxID=997883 RepID=A0A0E2B0R0_BACFG|nr:hypothetical protein HMPREF1055_00914 [Bacteroides fragilis CL07T00C01]EIY96121.1 hypothetical protein HMPREF1056_02009 [Bacteroides fragilis CL07T12C05]
MMNVLISYLSFLTVFWGYHLLTLKNVPTDTGLWGEEVE